MTRAAASAHPSSSAPVPPPPPDRHPKHPAYLFATHLSQSAEAAAAAHHSTHQNPDHTAQQEQAPGAPVADAAVSHGQSEYVHASSHTHSDSALPDVAQTEPTFDIQIHDHAHQDPPHLSDQPVSEMAPVTHEELQGAADHTQQTASRPDEPPLATEDLAHNAQHHDAQPLPLDHGSGSHHQSSTTGPVAPVDPMHVDAATSPQIHQASHIAQHVDTVQATDPERDPNSHAQIDSQSVRGAVHQGLHKAVHQASHGSTTSPGPHRRFDAEASTSAAEVLAEQMVAEGTHQAPRITSHNSGILQHLAAHAESPKSKRARLMQQKSPAILARGASISLARRAAATAKKRRDEARAELERNGICEGVERALEGIVGISASTRANVSQNREKRVQRVKWRPEEVDALKKGVEKYGVGRWAVILREFASAFDPVRISVDLKDKWRNIFKVPKTRVSRSNVNVDASQQNVLAGYVSGGMQQAQAQPIRPKPEIALEQGEQVSHLPVENNQIYATQQTDAQHQLEQHQHQPQIPQQHQQQTEDHSDAAMTELSQYEERVEHRQGDRGRKRTRGNMLEAINTSIIGTASNVSTGDHQPIDTDSSQHMQHAQVEDGVEQMVDEHAGQHVQQVAEQHGEHQMGREMEQSAEEQGEHQVEHQAEHQAAERVEHQVEHGEQQVEQQQVEQQHDALLEGHQERGAGHHADPDIEQQHIDQGETEEEQVIVHEVQGNEVHVEDERHAEQHAEQSNGRTGEHLDQLSVLPSEQPAEPLAESLTEPLTEQHVNDQLEAEVNEHAGEAQQHVEEIEKAGDEEGEVADGKLLEEEELHADTGQAELQVTESSVGEGGDNIHSFRG